MRRKRRGFLMGLETNEDNPQTLSINVIMDFSSREQSPHIIVSLLDEEHSTPINALIDSGAAGNFISERLANEIGVTTRNVGPINATNVDGSRIKPITKQTVPLHLEVAGRLQPMKLLVADIGEDIRKKILGYLALSSLYSGPSHLGHYPSI